MAQADEHAQNAGAAWEFSEVQLLGKLVTLRQSVDTRRTHTMRTYTEKACFNAQGKDACFKPKHICQQNHQYKSQGAQQSEAMGKGIDDMQ